MELEHKRDDALVHVDDGVLFGHVIVLRWQSRNSVETQFWSFVWKQILEIEIYCDLLKKLLLDLSFENENLTRVWWITLQNAVNKLQLGTLFSQLGTLFSHNLDGRQFTQVRLTIECYMNRTYSLSHDNKDVYRIKDWFWAENFHIYAKVKLVLLWRTVLKPKCPTKDQCNKVLFSFTSNCQTRPVSSRRRHDFISRDDRHRRGRRQRRLRRRRESITSESQTSSSS